MKKIFSTLLLLLVLITACQKEKYTYGLTSVDILQPSANKNKLKTAEQYVAVLYVNFFQKAISTKELVELERLIRSVGDKRLIYELIISNFLNSPEVILPTDSEMRVDLDLFLEETYRRFYVREATQIELNYYKNYLENNSTVNPEMVYFAFAISDEFFFY
tara:strand:- start:321 stop:803 length:483 start_codon:yes stop_codon:yes gene_type:complete